MREVEPVRVIALDYIISDDGTSNTCAKLRLQLSDPGSPLQGRTFDIELPPPNCGHAEFVVPKHRFLASVHRKWQVGDCCQACPCSGSESVADRPVLHQILVLAASGDCLQQHSSIPQHSTLGCNGCCQHTLCHTVLQCRVTSVLSCSVTLDAITFLASYCSYHAHLFALQETHNLQEQGASAVNVTGHMPTMFPHHALSVESHDESPRQQS